MIKLKQRFRSGCAWRPSLRWEVSVAG